MNRHQNSYQTTDAIIIFRNEPISLAALKRRYAKVCLEMKRAYSLARSGLIDFGTLGKAVVRCDDFPSAEDASYRNRISVEVWEQFRTWRRDKRIKASQKGL
jgi:hypothetical protein